MSKPTDNADFPIPGWRTVTDGEGQHLYRDGEGDHAVTISGSGDVVSIAMARGDRGAVIALCALLVGAVT